MKNENNQIETVKGYKVFRSDWTCRGFQYEIGKRYTHEGEIEPCVAGLHFCKELNSCFNYYNFDPNNKIAEVEALGEVKYESGKSVTNNIYIVREITWNEALEMINIGNGNTGRMNTGDSNTGDRNTGYSNTGDSNTGYKNTGDRNTGYSNTGYRNTGDRNTGDRNTGYSNTGDRNTGDYNSCNYSMGAFCSEEQSFVLFNKPTTITREGFRYSKANIIIRRNLNIIDGNGNKIEYKQAWLNMWNGLSNDEKNIIKTLPNFEGKVFKEITGIEV